MLLENTLLVAVWLAGVWPDYNFLVPLLVLASFFVGKFRRFRSIENFFTRYEILFFFVVGICFMGLYYRIFHPRRMEYYSSGRENADYPGSNSSTARLANKDVQNSRSTKQMNDINKLLTHGYSDKIAGESGTLRVRTP